jgi:mannosyltransferase OCH1-like enzyme
MSRLTVIALRAAGTLAVFYLVLHLCWSNLPFDLGLGVNQRTRNASLDDAVNHAAIIPQAQQIPASSLLSRKPTCTSGQIPTIFHQSWKSLDLPRKFESWGRTCRQHHKDWQWVVWTDEDNLQLVRKHFPWLEETYRGLPSEIYRADLSRYLYMHIYGGYVQSLNSGTLIQGRC